jgi:heme/copper-type cytochrome/quinol oxidase subunit 4
MLLLRQRVTTVWLALVTLTCASTWGMSADALSSRVAVPAIFLIAATKVWFVMTEFMELRRGPRQVRAAFGAWIAVVTALVLGLWLLAPSITEVG